MAEQVSLEKEGPLGGAWTGAGVQGGPSPQQAGQALPPRAPCWECGPPRPLTASGAGNLERGRGRPLFALTLEEGPPPPALTLGLLPTPTRDLFSTSTCPMGRSHVPPF